MRKRSDRGLVLTLRLEERGPGIDLRVLLEERAALTFGHPTPDAEFDPIVERIGSALHEHRAVPADGGGLALRGTPYEELVGVDFAAPRLCDPLDACFCLLVVELYC